MWIGALGLLALVGCGGAGPEGSTTAADGPPQRAVAARHVWERIARELPGAWQVTANDGAVTTISFRRVSADTALVESFVTPSGRETLTVYHLDGEGLLLTHYCAEGNQPRLRVVDADRDLAVFRRFDATNLRPDQAVLVERTLRLAGDLMELTETYRLPDGTTETTVLSATRVRTTPPTSR